MKYIRIGKIVNTHGVKGELRLISDFKYKDKIFVDNFKIYIGKEKIEEKINSYRRHKMLLTQKSTNVISLIITIILLVGLILLISCKFKYGIMVVGSGSMTGSINKGDAVIFEQYKKQELYIGDVIIFILDKTPTIHRIVDIQTLNNEKIYYTKGDNNQDNDQGFRVESDIKGIVKFRVIYIGWPTLWVNELFN